MGMIKQLGATLKSRLNPIKYAVNAAQKEAHKIEQNINDAHQELDKHVPSPKFEMSPDLLTDAEIDARLAQLEASSKLTHDYTDMLNAQTIVKPSELSEIDYAQRNREQLRRPLDPIIEERKKYDFDGKVPHGKCKPHDLVDIITNNRTDPAQWNITTIANELNLRQADVEHFLTHFDLIDEQAKFLNPDEHFEPVALDTEQWEQIQ